MSKPTANSNNFQQLCASVNQCDVLTIQNILENSVDIINNKDKKGKTPLHFAVSNGNLTIINILLKKGADVFQTTKEGQTPLHILALKGYEEIFEVLLQFVSKDKLNDFLNTKTSSSGDTALHFAAKFGFLEIVKSLLKHGAIYNIENKESKTPFNVSVHQNITNLLKLIEELFKNATYGSTKIISTLRALKPDEFVIATNARNNQGNVLLQVAIINKQKLITKQLLEMLLNPDKFQSCCILEYKIEQYQSLKRFAERHIELSSIYMSMLKSMSHVNDSEINTNPWKTVKEGSYFLRNVYVLVTEYKEHMLGTIIDENIKTINDTLIELEFNPEHISSGYTDEAYGGTAKCFVSKGQGTKYYALLHSKFTKDVRAFIEMAERCIDDPVKRFLKSLEKKLQSISTKSELCIQWQI